jgi:hypothetical protein
MTTFDSTKTELRTLLDEIAAGKIQLPNFSGAGFGTTNTSVLCSSASPVLPDRAVMPCPKPGQMRTSLVISALRP